MSFKVVYTDNFERELKKLTKRHPSLKSDLIKLIASLETNPAQGTALGKNCFKIRLAISSKAKGKSGGARVITHLFVVAQTVFLLSIYDKTDKDSVSDKELQAMLQFLKD